MGIAHDPLSVAAERRRRIRDLRRIPADNDQRSPFRSSLAGNCQTDAGVATNYDDLLTLEPHFGPLQSKPTSLTSVCPRRVAMASRRRRRCFPSMLSMKTPVERLKPRAPAPWRRRSSSSPRHSSQLHRFDRGARHDDDGRVVPLQALVEHVHRAQMECGRIVRVALRRLVEFLRDLPFGIAEDHARLPLALGLRLHRHRILQGRRYQHVLELHRNDVDAPRLGASVDYALQFAADLLPTLEHVGERGLADDVAERGL